MTQTELDAARIRASALHHWALLDARLSPYAKVTLLALLALRDNKDFCAPGVGKLSVMLGMSETALTRALRRLQEVGYVEPVGTPPHGRGHKQVYRLHLTSRYW